ncbi:MAG: hypothetical protein ABH804_01760 [archaeon]
MPKKSKLSTPGWILEGYDSKKDYEKLGGIKNKSKKTGKIYKIKVCPKCSSDDVGVILSNLDSEEGGGKEWECRKCSWKGKDVQEKELNEDEFLKYLESKNE